MAGKSCHILRPVPIEHEYDPVIYKDAHYVTTWRRVCRCHGRAGTAVPDCKGRYRGLF